MRRRAGSGRRAARLASIRYSVGAWQSTLTPSASAKSSRSAGSKRPSWMTAAAPVSQGARKTLRADFDQPGRRRAPGQLALARAEPVLGLRPLAEQVAVGVDDAARLAGGAGGEDDQRRVLGVHRLDRAPASPAAGPRRERRRPRPSSSPAPRPAARRAARPRRRRASGSPRPPAARGRLRRSCVLQGSATAPIRQQASSVSTHSIRLPTSVITTSPRPTPPSREGAREPRRASDQFAEVPVPPTSLGIDSNDSAAAKPETRSITSSMKFTRGSLPYEPGLCEVGRAPSPGGSVKTLEP